MPMLTLYYAPGTASLCVHHFLIELGLEHRLELVDFASKGQKSPEYLKLNPRGVVPTLVVDGEPMVESAAILMWLAEQDPQARFVPGEGSRARRDYLQWFMLLANALQPPFRNWFYAHEPAGEANAETVKANARPQIEAIWDRVNAHLEQRGPYVCGAQLTAVDFFLFMLMRWSRNMPKPATEWPYCAMFVASMKARPSFKTLYEREGLTEWA
jgi:glutathione S-transferase